MLTGKGIWTTTSKRFSHSTLTSGVCNLVANGNFENGATPTGWTFGTGVIVSSSLPIEGTYSARFADTGTITSDKHPVAGTSLSISFKAKSTSGKAMSGSASIKFYDATPTLISTVTLKTWTSETVSSPTVYENTVSIPSTATQFEFVGNITSASGVYAYFDNVVVVPILG